MVEMQGGVLFNSRACAHRHGGVVAEGLTPLFGGDVIDQSFFCPRNGSSVSSHRESCFDFFPLLPLWKAPNI